MLPLWFAEQNNRNEWLWHQSFSSQATFLTVVLSVLQKAFKYNKHVCHYHCPVFEFPGGSFKPVGQNSMQDLLKFQVLVYPVSLICYWTALAENWVGDPFIFGRHLEPSASWGKSFEAVSCVCDTWGRFCAAMHSKHGGWGCRTNGMPNWRSVLVSGVIYYHTCLFHLCVLGMSW